MAKKTNNDALDGVLLFSKKPGKTSFSSLWSIKHALGTDKVGHTGTLDSFAEGLLVVLSGHLTHLVPHITGFTKTYRALVCFGKETPSLDPCTAVTKTLPPPSSKEAIIETLKEFTGALLQVPPVYSSLHVAGKRSSALVREGKEVELESRQIFVYKNELLDYRAPSPEDECSYALLEIQCSKGTYIRALARDIAKKLGTVSYLMALRRIQVGPFLLEDAAWKGELEDFTIDYGIKNAKTISSLNSLPKILSSEKKREKDSPEEIEDIKNHFLIWTPALSSLCGFQNDIIKSEWEKSYQNGRPLSGRMFTRMESSLTKEEIKSDKEFSVFYDDMSFAGMIGKKDGRLSYGFVVPKKNSSKLRTFSWKDIEEGHFPLDFKGRGTAISVGSFDGFHLGHQKLLDSLMAEKKLVPGVVTFRNSYRSFSGDYEGDVSTLEQRLDFLADKGISFAIVVDFSDDFSKIDGRIFVEKLLTLCGMKFMTEGKDFSCGYKGMLTSEGLSLLADEKGFKFSVQDDVLVEGEKVSSSRIRRAVKNGDMLLAHKMLGRPFLFDLRGLSFKKDEKSLKDNLFYFKAKLSGRQIYPQDGFYNVTVKLGGKKDFNLFHTQSLVEKGFISILLPSQETADRLEAVKIEG